MSEKNNLEDQSRRCVFYVMQADATVGCYRSLSCFSRTGKFHTYISILFIFILTCLNVLCKVLYHFYTEHTKYTTYYSGRLSPAFHGQAPLSARVQLPFIQFLHIVFILECRTCRTRPSAHPSSFNRHKSHIPLFE